MKLCFAFANIVRIITFCRLTLKRMERRKEAKCLWSQYGLRSESVYFPNSAVSRRCSPCVWYSHSKTFCHFKHFAYIGMIWHHIMCRNEGPVFDVKPESFRCWLRRMDGFGGLRYYVCWVLAADSMKIDIQDICEPFTVRNRTFLNNIRLAVDNYPPRLRKTSRLLKMLWLRSVINQRDSMTHFSVAANH